MSQRLQVSRISPFDTCGSPVALFVPELQEEEEELDILVKGLQPDLSSQTKNPARINEPVRLELLKKKIHFSSLTLLVSFFCAISSS